MVGGGVDGGDETEVVVCAGGVTDGGGDYGWGSEDDVEGQAEHDGFTNPRQRDGVVGRAVSGEETLGGCRSICGWILQGGGGKSVHWGDEGWMLLLWS